MNETDYIPQGVSWGSDSRPVVIGVLVAVNVPTRSCQVSISGQDPIWVPYVWQAGLSARKGQQVWVQRDPITGRAMLCLGPAGLPEQQPTFPYTPSADIFVGTVTSASPLRVQPSGVGGSAYYCGKLASYTATVGDIVLVQRSESFAWVVGVVTSATPATLAAPSSISFITLNQTVFAYWPAVTNANRYWVSMTVDGGATWTSTYTYAASVGVPIEQGQTVRIDVSAETGSLLGPAATGTYSWPAPGDPTPVVVARAGTALAQWSGSWFPQAGIWGGWSLNGRPVDYSTLIVGSKFGQGPMVGAAIYRDRISALQADSITDMTLTLVPGDQGDTDVTIRGITESAPPNAAPTPVGDSFTATVASPYTVVNVPATVREAFRTGAIGGLQLTGSQYGEVRGTSGASSMSLRFTYTKTI